MSRPTTGLGLPDELEADPSWQTRRFHHRRQTPARSPGCCASSATCA